MKTIKLSYLISALLLLAYLTLSLWTASGSEFHQDEYQHAHIAWNTFTGKKIYQDFFETHGPLSAWTFSSLISLKPEPIASPDTLLYLRKIVASFALLNGLLVFLCLRVLGANSLISILGSTIFFGTVTFQATAFRIRPDTFIQTLFLLSLILWIKRYRFVTGVLMGIAVGLNPKFLPFNLTLLLMDLLLLRSYSEEKRKWPALIGGEIIVLALIAIKLSSMGVLKVALHDLFIQNSLTVMTRLKRNDYQFQLLKCLLEVDIPLLVAVLVASGAVFILVCKKKIVLNPTWSLLSTLGLTSFFFLASPLWHHSSLFVIPIFVLIITLIVEKVFSKEGVPEGILCLFAFMNGINSYRALPRYTYNLTPNFKSLEKVLAESERSQPVFYLWPSRCPAYIFNSDSNVFWGQQITPPGTVKLKHYNRLLNPKITWVAVDDILMERLRTEEKNTLKNRFEKYDCVWKRK